MTSVSIRNVTRSYGKVKAKRDLTVMDLEIDHNEFVVLIGPSGGGQSTMRSALIAFAWMISPVAKSALATGWSITMEP